MIAIDAEFGIIVRQVTTVDGTPVARFEVREVAEGEVAGPDAFWLAADPDMPEIESDGGALDGLDLPVPVRAAAQATGTLLAGTAKALGRMAGQARRARDERQGR